MFTLVWLASTGALAGTGAPDANRVCASKERVALSPVMRKRFRAPRGCKVLVPAQPIADYLKAFAVYGRELHDVKIADLLVKHVDARWLIVDDGKGYRVYDGEAKAFVDNAVFSAEGAVDETPAEAAHRRGYQALRAKRYADAKKHLSECLEHDPEHVGCHWELGWVHWVAEDWAAAAAAWTQVETRQPDYPELGEWLPKARAKAGD